MSRWLAGATCLDERFSLVIGDAKSAITTDFPSDGFTSIDDHRLDLLITWLVEGSDTHGPTAVTGVLTPWLIKALDIHGLAASTELATDLHETGLVKGSYTGGPAGIVELVTDLFFTPRLIKAPDAHGPATVTELATELFT